MFISYFLCLVILCSFCLIMFHMSTHPFVLDLFPGPLCHFLSLSSHLQPVTQFHCSTFSLPVRKHLCSTLFAGSSCHLLLFSCQCLAVLFLWIHGLCSALPLLVPCVLIIFYYYYFLLNLQCNSTSQVGAFRSTNKHIS